MGTLHDQRPRPQYEEDIDDLLTRVKRLSEKHKLPAGEVIAAMHVAELRRANFIATHDGDAWDEQISGIGKILENLADAVSALREDR